MVLGNALVLNAFSNERFSYSNSSKRILKYTDFAVGIWGNGDFVPFWKSKILSFMCAARYGQKELILGYK